MTFTQRYMLFSFASDFPRGHPSPPQTHRFKREYCEDLAEAIDAALDHIQELEGKL